MSPAHTVRHPKKARTTAPRFTQSPSRNAPQPDALRTTDPRWAFAVRVAAALEGGRAAILRPEARERLLRTARLLGIRPFDAALIIAMVQDTARRGETPPGHAPLTPALAESLASVREPERTAHAPAILQRLAGVLLIAAAMVAAAILWLNGAPA